MWKGVNKIMFKVKFLYKNMISLKNCYAQHLGNICFYIHILVTKISYKYYILLMLGFIGTHLKTIQMLLKASTTVKPKLELY